MIARKNLQTSRKGGVELPGLFIFSGEGGRDEATRVESSEKFLHLSPGLAIFGPRFHYLLSAVAPERFES